MSAPFPFLSRLLHWLMAILIVAMLLIGAGMANTVSARYHCLVSIHEPLGIAILVLVLIRFINRWLNPPPPLPPMPKLQRYAAHASHWLLYLLMFALPLVGWAMLSAADTPIVLYGGLRLPHILPQDPALYARLRGLHGALATLLYAVFLLHLAAALLHGLIRRDGVFSSMASLKPRAK
jgi:cytochrome b561